MEDNHIPFIHLVGDPLENLYRLGRQDSQSYRPLMEHTRSLLRSPWKPINTAIDNIMQTFLPRLVRGKGEWEKSINAYAEGVGVDSRDILPIFLIPEILPSTARWIPRLSSLGCSSYFLHDTDRNVPIHGRILDFPLVDSFDTAERAILYEFTGSPKIFSFGSSGFPYPSITAMTEKGVTFGLHQKISDVFDTKGTPIFEIIYNLLKNCDDSKSAIEFLNKSRSITTWAFYMSFENGDVLTADLMGDHLDYDLHKLDASSEGICRCNSLINPEKRKKQTYPFGFHESSQTREEVGHKKIQNLKSANAEELVKSMGSPLADRQDKSISYEYDAMTIINVQSVVMSPKTGEALFLPGNAPKFYRGDYIHFTDVFNSPKQELVVDKNFKKNDQQENYRQGMRALAVSEKCYKQGDRTEAYHQIQMGIEKLKGYHEEFFGQFFFLVFQYVNETKKEALFQLLGEFKSIEKKLSPYLSDQCRLFIFRLEKRLRRPVTITAESIQHPGLRDVFEMESGWNLFILKFLTKNLIYINLSGKDVVYPWTMKDSN